MNAVLHSLMRFRDDRIRHLDAIDADSSRPAFFRRSA